MKRVAICLSGETRSLDITKKLFSTIHKIKGYDIDFFIATWDSCYNEQYLSFPKLKAYDILNEKDWVKQTELGYKSNNFKYSFLLKKCNLLKQKYEIDNKFTYDCVIISRIDAIFIDIQSGIKQLIESNIDYDYNGIEAYLNDTIRYSNKNTPSVDDNFCIQNSLTSDIYTNIHFLYYGDTMNKFSHSLEINAYILRRYNIVTNSSDARIGLCRPSNIHLWIRELVKNNSLNYSSEESFKSSFKNAKRSVNNLRIQCIYDGAILIDIRNKEYVFDKIGFLTILQQFINNLAVRLEDSDLIIIGDIGDKCKVEALNIRINNLKVTEGESIKQVLKTVKKDNILLTTPTNFISFQHNFFYDKCIQSELAYLNLRRNNTPELEKPYSSFFTIQNSVKNKLLELDFDLLEDIDLTTFSKQFNNVLRQKLYESTDIDNLKNIYQSLI